MAAGRTLLARTVASVKSDVQPRAGIWLFPSAPVGELVDAIVAADAAGVDEVWIADEGVMREPVVALSAAAVLTSHIKLGVGITTPVIRHPGAIAATLATLDELSNGRAMLGFGVGGNLTLTPFGLQAEKPVALIRTAIRTARAVLQRQPADGYEPPDHAMPARSVPIFVASRGEQINRLASREADGAFLSGVPIDDLERQIGLVRSERAIHVALFPSARFRPPTAGGADDRSALRGTPADIAAGMVDLVHRFQPESIGLCLVDRDPIATMVDAALEAIALFRSLV